jgi:hypothetical protein
MKTIKTIGLVVAGIVVGLLFSTTGATKVGGVYNQVIQNFEKGIVASSVNYINALTQTGGTLTITQTGATRTLTEQELIDNNVIEIATTAGAALTLTLPATSTMVTLLPGAGDVREWFIDNQHAAATTTTIAAGAGIDLIAVTANDDVIDGQEVARLTCWRKTVNTDVYCLVSENLKAD